MRFRFAAHAVVILCTASCSNDEGGDASEAESPGEVPNSPEPDNGPGRESGDTPDVAEDDVPESEPDDPNIPVDDPEQGPASDTPAAEPDPVDPEDPPSEEDGEEPTPPTGGAWTGPPEVERFVRAFCEAGRRCGDPEFEMIDCEATLLQPCLWAETPAPAFDERIDGCEEYLETADCVTSVTEGACAGVVEALRGFTVAATGETCGFDVHCAETDICTSERNTCGGTCVRAGIGDPCLEGECADGVCNADVCEDPRARPAPNAERVAEGQPCAVSIECQDGLWCIEAECRPEGVEGDACAGDGCAEGLYCGDTGCTRYGSVGDPCDSGAQCDNDLECYQGSCVLVPITCEPGQAPGDPCSLRRECSREAGLACDEGVICVEGRGPGETCEFTEDCIYGLVCYAAVDATTGTCSERLPVGSDCQDNGLCETALCVDGVCALRPEGEACAEDEQCESGVCNTDQRCGEKPAGCP